MKIKKTSVFELEKELKKLLEEGVMNGVFPAAAAGITIGLERDKKQVISFYGNEVIHPEKRLLKINHYFDLASLTKPLATTMAVLCLIKEKKIDIGKIFTESLFGTSCPQGIF